jgi:hypothetical protein
MCTSGTRHNVPLARALRYYAITPTPELQMIQKNAAEANRLYWESDKSVAEISETLDLSRRALYDAIEPLPADTTCPTCGGPMVYANRSARDNRQGTCYACATGSPQEAPAAEPEAWTWSPGGQASSRTPAVLRRDEVGHRARRLGGAALIGACLGAVVTHMLLPRD